MPRRSGCSASRSPGPGDIDKPFDRFDRLLRDKGYLAISWQILDASLVAAPRQHLDGGEKQAI